MTVCLYTRALNAQEYARAHELFADSTHEHRRVARVRFTSRAGEGKHFSRRASKRIRDVSKYLGFARGFFAEVFT